MMVVDQPRTTKEELVDGLKAVGTRVIKNTIGYTYYLIMDWNHHFIKLADSSEDRILISHIVCSFRNCYKEFYLCCFHTCTTALNFSKRYPPRICMRARKHLIQPEETSFGLSEFALCDWCESSAGDGAMNTEILIFSVGENVAEAKGNLRRRPKLILQTSSWVHVWKRLRKIEKSSRESL